MSLSDHPREEVTDLRRLVAGKRLKLYLKILRKQLARHSN
jgi:hypothetical protein